jgi:hypothetical protein
VGKSEGKVSLERPRRGWKNRINFILIGWEGVGRINLAQDDQWQAVVDVVQNLRFDRLEEIY